jgi:thymidylate synthase (FAD)
MREIVPAAEALLGKEVRVLDHGFVTLVDYMGSDAAIVEAARQSMAGNNTKTSSDDRALIRRLVRDRHTSPLEMVELKFSCQMPIFVARQWIRHRTANVNEMSGRYGELPELTYVPEAEQIAYQSPVNKQGRGGLASPDVAAVVQGMLRELSATAFSDYHEFLGHSGGDSRMLLDHTEEASEIAQNGGISRELARINLPVSTYTRWYWKIDLHNLLHFLSLRLDPHAQWEIRQYAEVMAATVRALCPVAWEAFVDFRLDAVTLSGPEVRALRHLADLQVASGTISPSQPREFDDSMSRSEQAVFRSHLQSLGLSHLIGVAGSPAAEKP